MDFEYKTHTQRPHFWGGAIFCTAFLVFGYLYQAPWIWLVIAAIPVCMLWTVIVLRIESGIQINGLSVKWYDGRHEGRVWCKDIQSVEVRAWSDSTDVRLHLRDGTRVDIPTNSYPRAEKLIAAFDVRGIRVDHT